MLCRAVACQQQRGNSFALAARADRPRLEQGVSTLSVDERHYKLMRLLEENPELSQRELARELGISLGKVNYCLKALIRKGWIKVSNFTNSQNKAAYMYLLTPRGVEQKAGLTMRFLKLKMKEYEMLRAEIRQMRREATIAMSRKGGKGSKPIVVPE